LSTSFQQFYTSEAECTPDSDRCPVQPHSLSRRMSNKSTSYLIHLNWGYRLGLWTYYVEVKNNHASVKPSLGKLHNLFSTLLTISIMSGHIIFMAMILSYEWFKPKRAIWETILVVGTALILVALIIIHTFSLRNMDFLSFCLQNTSALRRFFCK